MCYVLYVTYALLEHVLRIYHSDVIMSALASQITSVFVVYSTVCSGADHRKHISSASLTFVRGIHRWPVNSPHKGTLTWKMFTFDDVIIMKTHESASWIPLCTHFITISKYSLNTTCHLWHHRRYNFQKEDLQLYTRYIRRSVSWKCFGYWQNNPYCRLG